MPNKCVKCGKIYDELSKDLLKGCSNCGSKFFYFIRDSASTNKVELLDDDAMSEISKDIKGITGHDRIDGPIILDLETVNIEKPGKYSIDINKLFKQSAIVFKIKDGKYVIDLGRLSRQD